MDKDMNEVLMDIDSQIKQTDECEWDTIRDIFAEAIKRKGLSKEQVHEINKRILKEVRKDKKININN